MLVAFIYILGPVKRIRMEGGKLEKHSIKSLEERSSLCACWHIRIKRQVQHKTKHLEGNEIARKGKRQTTHDMRTDRSENKENRKKLTASLLEQTPAASPTEPYV